MAPFPVVGVAVISRDRRDTLLPTLERVQVVHVLVEDRQCLVAGARRSVAGYHGLGALH